MRVKLIFGLALGACVGLFFSAPQSAAPQAAPKALLDTYCVTCHNDKLKTAGLALDTVDVTKPSANPEVWEKVIGKLRAGSMPPRDALARMRPPTERWPSGSKM